MHAAKSFARTSILLIAPLLHCAVLGSPPPLWEGFSSIGGKVFERRLRAEFGPDRALVRWGGNDPRGVFSGTGGVVEVDCKTHETHMVRFQLWKDGKVSFDSVGPTREEFGWELPEPARRTAVQALHKVLCPDGLPRRAEWEEWKRVGKPVDGGVIEIDQRAEGSRWRYGGYRATRYFSGVGGYAKVDCQRKLIMHLTPESWTDSYAQPVADVPAWRPIGLDTQLLANSKCTPRVLPAGHK